MRNAYKISIGQPEWKRLFGRSMSRWEDKIRMDFREVGCKGCGLAAFGPG
jgi:hypothetical protein